MSIRKLFLIISVFSFGVKAFGFSYEHLGVEDGLSHPWVKSILLDLDNNLWLGTANGLNKYNGSEITILRSSKENANSLSDDFINALSLGPEGNLWIGTLGGGLNCYYPKLDSFIVYRSAPSVSDALPTDHITSLFLDSRKRLWVGTSKGLLLYDASKNSFKRNPLGNYGLNIKGSVNQIIEDHLGQLWIATNDGVFMVHLENRITRSINSQNAPLENKPFKALYEDEQHNIWVGTIGAGVVRIDSEWNYDHYNLENGLSNNRVLTINGDRNGKVYIGTEGGGLNIFYLNDGELEVTKFEPNNPKSIESNSVHSTYYDDISSILWIGTYHGGVNFTSRWDKKFRYLKMPELDNNYVLSIAEDQKGQIHIGTDGGGVNILQDGKVKKVIRSANSALLSDVVLSVLADHSGKMWYGTFQGGLSYFDDENCSIRNFLPGSQDGLSDNDVNSIYEDREGNIWLGTMNEGVNSLNPETEVFRYYKSYAGDSKSISNNYVSRIEELNEHEVLILTGAGIDIMNIESGECERFDSRFGTDIFPVRCFHIDSEGRIWLGADEWLYCVVPEGKHYRYNEANGLFAQHISSIEEDLSGNLWISTHRGLIKAIGAVHNPDEVDFHLFTMADGLPGLDFNRNASLRASDGTMYFGCNSGLIMFKPEDIWLNPVKPKVTFTELRVLDKLIDFRTSELLDQPIQYTQEITLDYDQNVFSIDFTSSNFLLPSKNKFSYLLEGFDSDWSAPTARNYARYTNLLPGDYKLKVKSANNDGIWNSEPAEVSIRIIPPWWELVWVRVLGLMFIIVSVFIAFQVRIKSYKKNQVLLKKRVDEATSEIKNVNSLLERNVEDLISKNELLQQQNVSLENQAEKIQSLMEELKANSESKMKFFTNISHELRTPLTLIIGPVKELISKSSNANSEQFKIILDNANRLLRNVNQLLDFRKLETGNSHLIVTKTDISQFVHDIYDSFEFLARKRGIKYQFIDQTGGQIGLIDLEKFEKVIMNLISNAFKFTPDEGRISVTLEKDHEMLQLIISDSGSGIKPDDLEKIFDLYYEGNPYSGDKGTGLGLAIIKQVVELHHGEIKVSSALQKGTNMIIRLPLNEEVYSQDERMPDDVNIPVFDPAIISDLDEESGAEEEYIMSEGNYKLLIVEDNVDIRKYIKRALSAHFEILEADNGKSGLEMTGKYHPDFIISDVMMPEMNGTEMCRKIKDDPELAHIPVILLTAYSGDENKIDGYSSGADDYMVKPFDVNLLRSKMLNRAMTRTTLLQNYKKHASLDLSRFDSTMTDVAFMDQVISFLDEHLSNGNLGVEDISEQFSMSRRNLLRKIKSNTGLSVSEFIKNIRLKKAAELLTVGSFNISEVAYKTGFNDPKYFSKCFRQEFGVSPSDFTKS